MKEFLEAIEKDYKSENFTKTDWVVYGIIVPALFILICLVFS